MDVRKSSEKDQTHCPALCLFLPFQQQKIYCQLLFHLLYETQHTEEKSGQFTNTDHIKIL